MPSMTEIFGEPISVYTRAQALEDGALIDVSELAREAGFTGAPVAITASIHALIEANDRNGQSYTGRLWDVLNMAMVGIRMSNAKPDLERVRFQVLMLDAKSRRRRHGMICHIGGGDNGEGVITIMLPEDD